MFERFTDRARRVLVLAKEEARLLGHGFIGTEHILLGLIHEGDGVAAETLESLGITLEAVRTKVEETIGPAPSATTTNPPFTPRAKKVLELSLREALQLGHNYIGTEHILLGLVREGEGIAAQALQSLGADLPRVREAVLTQLGSYEKRRQPIESSDPRPSRSHLMGEVDWPRHPLKVVAGSAEPLSSGDVTFRVIGVFLYDDGIEVVWRISWGGPGENEIADLKISVDGDPHYISTLGELEPQEGGELAGRSYLVPEILEQERPLIDAQTLTIQWQGQSIEVDL